MANERRFDELSDQETQELLASGEVTPQEIDEQLQEHARREAAERDAEELPDSTERVTVGGFGSGQGMGTERTGQEPDRPDDQGFPRTKDTDWPT
jgi:hypothetical protein